MRVTMQSSKCERRGSTELHVTVHVKYEPFAVSASERSQRGAAEFCGGAIRFERKFRCGERSGDEICIQGFESGEIFARGDEFSDVASGAGWGVSVAGGGAGDGGGEDRCGDEERGDTVRGEFRADRRRCSRPNASGRRNRASAAILVGWRSG